MPDQAAEAIDRVASSVERLATASHELHQDVSRMNRQQRAQSVILGVLALVVVFLLVAGVIDYRERREAQRSRERIEALATEIDDCTSPDGTCAKRGQAATAQAVANITQANIAIAVCERQQAADIEQCVMSRLH